MRAWVLRILLCALTAVGCDFTIPSGRFVCDTTDDCPPEMTCVESLCVDSENMDAGRDGATPGSCPALAPPAHGSVNPTTGVAGDVATYSCDDSYVLTGNGSSSTRRCQSDGSWSGTAPTCEPVVTPCEPNPCLNGGTCTEVSDTFTCECDPASGFTGATCEERVACEALTVPDNGSVDRTSGVFGDVATYSCDGGYELTGNGGSNTRECQVDGSWSGTAPTCEPVECGTLSAPDNGSVDRTTGVFGDEATYACDSLYYLEGEGSRTCQADGTWSGSAPSCLSTGGYPLWPMPGTVPHPFDYDVGSETVLDNVTGLEWQRAVDPGSYTWEEAKSYCAALVLDGKTDWRLPTRIDLVSIVDYGRYDPAIDTSVFPSTPSEPFWSSSPYAGAAGRAWHVGFSYGGNTSNFAVTNTYRVRCVR